MNIKDENLSEWVCFGWLAVCLFLKGGGGVRVGNGQLNMFHLKQYWL